MCVKDKHNKKTTVGLVMVQAKSGSKSVYQQYGHTAILVRIDGDVRLVKGFEPAGAPPEKMSNPSVSGAWKECAEMVEIPEAVSFEWEVTVDVANSCISYLNNDVAEKKWKYHFVSLDEGKNCVHAALKVLKELSDNRVGADADALKFKLKSEFHAGANKGKDQPASLGYSQQRAMKEAGDSFYNVLP